MLCVTLQDRKHVTRIQGSYVMLTTNSFELELGQAVSEQELKKREKRRETQKREDDSKGKTERD